jgi:hypothetical protein
MKGATFKQLGKRNEITDREDCEDCEVNEEEMEWMISVLKGHQMIFSNLLL